MGYVRSREEVFGFEPHRFGKLPALALSPQGPNVENEKLAEWMVARLELVSLLKHDPPAIYISEHLPRMDELKDAPTRPLDAFERQALPQLHTAEDVVADESLNVIRMVGSLRAGNNCLQCHSVNRGELLGAFSYELRRTQPIPEPTRPAPAAVQ